MKNELNPFDRRIKDKLKNHEVPFEDSHWDQMEEKLEQDVDPVAGDALILSRMADWEVPLEESNWARMEKHLDHEEALNADFDRTAAERLSRMEAPYEGANWEMMTQKIDEAFSIRHWLHRYHVPELALMILFGFTLIQYLQWGPLPGRFVKSLGPHVEIEKISDQTSVNQAAQTVATISLESISEETRASFTKESGNKVKTQAANASLSEVPIPGIPVEISVTPPIDIADATEGIQSIQEPLFSLFDPGYTPASSHFPNLESFARGSAIAGLDAFRQLLKKPTRLYAGAYAGLDYNIVHAPIDEVFETQGYWTDSIGYHTGLLFSTEKKKWSFQTGLTYSEVAYKPIIPVQQYGTFDYLVIESFKEIQFQFLQIPLEVRRGFLSEQFKWDMYAMGGVKANLIFDASYDIEREELFSSRSSGVVEDVADKSKLNEKRFPEGILNGDRFFHNAYLSFSVGLGMERTFSDRYKFFAEPIYTRPFVGDEIGPNDDRIHQFSLRMGVKMQLR